jgi:pyruvate dehydrogenase E1 component alpha subunit
MAEMYGKREGCSRGRGGSMHLFDAKTRFYGGNAIVGGGLPLAVGLALASKMKKENRVTACYFGDGAVAEGAFHESMNLAQLWRLPVAFFCENNLYAMGTALERSESQTDLCVKAAAFGMATLRVDGMDVVATHDAAKGRARTCAPARARSSSSSRPTASAPIRCSMPSSTATRPRSIAGRRAGRSTPSARA